MTAFLPAGARVAPLTQHGNERVIAPALQSAFGVSVERVTGIGTGAFATFTREVARSGTRRNFARKSP